VAQKFDTERFGLKKLSDMEVKKQLQVKFSDSFAALKNLGDDHMNIL
jgi:hypothetical protein